MERPMVRIPAVIVRTGRTVLSRESSATACCMGTIRRCPVRSYNSTTPRRKRPDPSRFRIMYLTAARVVRPISRTISTPQLVSVRISRKTYPVNRSLVQTSAIRAAVIRFTSE